MKTEKLSNEQIIEICDKVIMQINAAKIIGDTAFLCILVQIEIEKMLNIDNCNNISKYIPKFNYSNAKKHANALKSETVWWLKSNIRREINYSDRIKFMQWIKSQYQNKQNENK